MDYQLELKQIVDYPRCRIYREFLRSLMEDRDIRTNGSSYLFYYMTLCSYANFRSSYRRIEGISYGSYSRPRGSAGRRNKARQCRCTARG